MFAVPDNTVALAENSAVLRHPVRVALEFAAARERWRHLLRYDPDHRFSTKIAGNADEEVWLMGWLPGQGTDLHDHANSTGAFTIVSGRLTEIVVRRGHIDLRGGDLDPAGGGHAGINRWSSREQRSAVTSERTGSEPHVLGAGQSRVFGPAYVHQVCNDGPDPAISIHVYRAERAMRSYRLDPVSGPVRE